MKNMNSTEYYREYRRKNEGKPLYTEEDMIECLICHKQYILLGAHVYQTHKMFMLDYKIKFGLDTKRGRTKGQFKLLKNKTNKGVANLKNGAKYRFVKGGPIPKYKRSLETLQRLSKQFIKI